MPPLETEEEAAEREAAAEEERRKAETLSDIEVTVPSLLSAGAIFCLYKPMAPDSGLGVHPVPKPRQVQCRGCFTLAPGASVMIRVLVLSVIPRS